MSDQGVTIRECVLTNRTYEYKFYSDDAIRDLFDDDEDTLVIALLNRARQAEAEIERLRNVLLNWRTGTMFSDQHVNCACQLCDDLKDISDRVRRTTNG